jgi:glycosyltransferase involved in cell wall biosynthesis
MTQKKLIIFIPTIEDGGVEKNLFIISDYLIDKINSISLITINEKLKYRFNKKIEFISLKRNFCENLGRRKKFFICLFLLFKELLKNRNTLVMSFQGNIYCTILCKLMGIKVIVRSNSSPEGWSKNLFKTFCFKLILSLADKIIVNSLEFKKKFKYKFNLNTVCIYNPLNKKEVIKKSKVKTKIKFNKDKLNLINVGRLVDQKDQLTILKSLNKLKKRINFNLIIVGKGEKKISLLKYIKSNGLSKFVKLINYNKNPFNLIKKSDVFILSSRYEGLPNVLLEAQALKTYIISSNCPTGPKEILLNGKAGFLFPVGDYEALSKLIEKFFKNKKKYNKKILLGYNNLTRFDFKKNLEKYLFVIKSLI